MCLDCMVIICRRRLFGCFDARFNYKRACCFRLARFDIVYRKTSLEQFDDLQHPLSPKIHYLAVTSAYLSRAAIVLVLSVAGGFFLAISLLRHLHTQGENHKKQQYLIYIATPQGSISHSWPNNLVSRLFWRL